MISNLLGHAIDPRARRGHVLAGHGLKCKGLQGGHSGIFDSWIRRSGNVPICALAHPEIREVIIQDINGSMYAGVIPGHTE